MCRSTVCLGKLHTLHQVVRQPSERVAAVSEKTTATEEILIKEHRSYLLKESLEADDRADSMTSHRTNGIKALTQTLH